jgi:AraC-like DNA-binding protein
MSAFASARRFLWQDHMNTGGARQMTSWVIQPAALADAANRIRSLSPARPSRGEIRRRHRQIRIHAYVDAHLADPDLSAAVAARALGLSLRSLHLALAPTGESFNVLVRRRRLDACLVLLRQPDRGDNIAGVAFACGFNSLSSFYRAFRRIHKTCPSDRAICRLGPPVHSCDHATV